MERHKVKLRRKGNIVMQELRKSKVKVKGIGLIQNQNAQNKTWVIQHAATPSMGVQTDGANSYENQFPKFKNHTG